jgi:hypothetical protein
MENDISNSELIERAAQIAADAAADGVSVLGPEASETLRRAAAVQEQRQSSGISRLVDGVLGSILGEKKITEQRLAELRAAEARAEQLLLEQSAVAKTIGRQEQHLSRLKDFGRGYAAAGEPKAIKELFEKRCWAIGQGNFDAHVRQAATEALASKMIAEHFEVFLDFQNGEIAKSRERLKEIGAEIKRLTK